MWGYKPTGNLRASISIKNSFAQGEPLGGLSRDGGGGGEEKKK